MTSLVDDLVPAELWAIVEPLLPVPPRPPYGGRRRAVRSQLLCRDRVHGPYLDPMAAAAARESGSPATCWRRLTEWAKAGVFDQLHLEILDRLGQHVLTGRAGVRGHHECARQAGGSRGRNQSIGVPRSKLHLVCDGGGLPLTSASSPPTSTTPPCSRRCWTRSPPREPSRVGGGAARQGLCRQELRQRRQSCLSATADHRTDRLPWDRVIGQAGSASLAGRAVAVMVELLAAALGCGGTGTRSGGLRSCW